MKIVFNSKIVPPGFIGITLIIIFVKFSKEYIIKKWGDFYLRHMLNHESIHVKQQIELLVVPFFILYLLFFIINFFTKLNWMDAYRAIPFEREANANEDNMNYLNERKGFAWIRYIFHD